MSDPKRANLITVSAPKSTKKKQEKTVRLTINLYESNENEYPELDYNKLVRQTRAKEKRLNGTTSGLDDPFSNKDDEEVKRIAREMEQKYGGGGPGRKKSNGDESGDSMDCDDNDSSLDGKDIEQGRDIHIKVDTYFNKSTSESPYRKKGKSNGANDVDKGAGYDENDSFIDNSVAYDERVKPDEEPLYGGFYINCGSLEFKKVSDKPSIREDRKRQIVSSSSSDKESDSSSDSDSQDAKDTKEAVNGVDSHETEHRKKKNKDIDKQKAKKIRRTESTSATFAKQTSDDNGQGDAESADSRSSDSLTSKPAPSSENPSESSRDVEPKEDIKLPPSVNQQLKELEMLSGQFLINDERIEHWFRSLEKTLNEVNANENLRREVSINISKVLDVTADFKWLQRLKTPPSVSESKGITPVTLSSTSQVAQSTAIIVNTTTTVTTTNSEVHQSTNQPVSSLNKRKADEELEYLDVNILTEAERESKIEETLLKLKILIDERKPAMMAAYKADCERVQEEKKKLQIASTHGAPHIDKRRPKRRFPWCALSKALLMRLASLATAGASTRAAAVPGSAAAELLAKRALPLFPAGFVRMPTLLKQADLNKEYKEPDVKRPRVGSSSQPVASSTPHYMESIQFPSSLTVTTSTKTDTDEKEKYKNASTFLSTINSYALQNDLKIDKLENVKRDERCKEDSYIPNNVITITPVTHQKDKKASEKSKEALIRVKSPHALNEMIHKKDNMIHKKDNMIHKKEKMRKPEKSINIVSPLHIDTSYANKKDSASPKSKDEITQNLIEILRTKENNIPSPRLVKLSHSPTFVKPDKRPPEIKKKKDVVIVSDLNPLADIDQEPLSLDDSSSDVELVETRPDKSEPECKSEVPLEDKVKVNSVKHIEKVSDVDEITEQDIAGLTKSIQEMKNSQEPILNCNSYGGVITSAHTANSHVYNRSDARTRDNFTE